MNIKALDHWPFERGMYWWPVDSPLPKIGPVMWKVFPCHDTITYWEILDFWKCSNICAQFDSIWVRSWNCGCLVTWFCYQLIAKPGNKTASVSWPNPYVVIVSADGLCLSVPRQSGVWCDVYISNMDWPAADSHHSGSADGLAPK